MNSIYVSKIYLFIFLSIIWVVIFLPCILIYYLIIIRSRRVIKVSIYSMGKLT
uniref:Uncharacterized protein n=1 Tax=virus sp. ctML55 TaxID=2827627 RepID=A0A8S5RIB8_9VIRU|nr:MAG TPA: hypothetical protein [virus sp. ctML55]